jgi:hypothetical protein
MDAAALLVDHRDMDQAAVVRDIREAEKAAAIGWRGAPAADKPVAALRELLQELRRTEDPKYEASFTLKDRMSTRRLGHSGDDEEGAPGLGSLGAGGAQECDAGDGGDAAGDHDVGCAPPRGVTQ